MTIQRVAFTLPARPGVDWRDDEHAPLVARLRGAPFDGEVRMGGITLAEGKFIIRGVAPSDDGTRLHVWMERDFLLDGLDMQPLDDAGWHDLGLTEEGGRLYWRDHQ